jgi:hypothetical protein
MPPPPEPNHRPRWSASANLILVVAFASLGLLIGNLAGLSATSLVTQLIGLLFAFFGGSIIAYLTQLSLEVQRSAGLSIASFSIACLVGVYFGIMVSEFQLLSPQYVQRSDDEISANKYLRNQLVPKIVTIDQQLRAGLVTHSDAYNQLRAFVFDEGNSDGN